MCTIHAAQLFLYSNFRTWTCGLSRGYFLSFLLHLSVHLSRARGFSHTRAPNASNALRLFSHSSCVKRLAWFFWWGCDEETSVIFLVGMRHDRIEFLGRSSYPYERYENMRRHNRPNFLSSSFSRNPKSGEANFRVQVSGSLFHIIGLFLVRFTDMMLYRGLEWRRTGRQTFTLCMETTGPVNELN